MNLTRGSGLPSAAWSANNPPNKPAGPYIVGLAVIAVMMITSAVVTGLELTRQGREVAVLNQATSQPGLSYEITDMVADLAQVAEPSEAQRAELEETLDRFATVYLGLRFGNENLGLPGAPSDEVDRLLALADPLFNQVVTRGRSALEVVPSATDVALLELNASAYRARMDGVVAQYQRETEARVQTLSRLEFLLLSAGLLLLLAEGMFLFRPAARATTRRWQEARDRHEAERQQDKAELEYLSQFDPLTGLPNRVLFRDRIDQALLRARRTGGWVSVLFVNLDNFSVVNDQLGHDVGDHLLQQAAERIAGTIRAADTVAHLGGDEFAIVIEGDDTTEAAETVAEKAVAALAAPYLVNGREIFVSASIGVAVYPVDGDDAEALLRDSTLAMTAAKQAGRNTYQFFTAELRDRTSDRLALITSLRGAIEAPDQLALWYQPKLDIASGRVTGVEALIRWNHPEKGLIMPDRFIPIAEETGLIVPLDRWVLEEACRQMQTWRGTGLGTFSMSVNVSSRQFHQTGLADTVEKALRTTDLAPEHLEIEVTEGTLIEDIDLARVNLNSLRELGVRISIDDFGTGYSSLSYLKRLPIDVLKIDRSFISALPDDPDDAAISEAIVRLGHTLKMEIVAEGVETPEQYEFLRSLGCDTAQGYLIAAPLTAPKFADFVSSSTQLRAG